MERLTFEGNFCDISQCEATPGGSFCEDGTCSLKKVWERLKEYEDTGYAPAALATAVRIDEALARLGTTPERLVDLMEADKEGRLVVLPCRAGAPVWRIAQTFETYPDKGEQYVRNDTFFLSDLPSFGETVFLTREEAEKALEARNGNQ